MKIIKIFLILGFTFFTNTFAHKIEGIKIDVQVLDNNKMKIKGYFEKDGKTLVGNQIQLKSMYENKILFQAPTPKDGLIVNIPKEPYWIYLIIRDRDVVIDGIAPKEGFTKKKKEALAFKVSLFISLFLFITALIIIIYKKRVSLKES